MTEQDNVYIALAAAQADFGKVRKSSKNPHFKSNYADLSDIMNAVSKALTSNGLAIWHALEVNSEGHLVKTTLTHGSSKTEISTTTQLIIVKEDMQGLKSAITYAKRIGVECLTGIAADDDDDGNAAAASAAQEITATQYKELGVMLAEADADVEAFLKLFGIDQLEALKQTQFAEAKRKLNIKIAQRKGEENAATNS